MGFISQEGLANLKKYKYMSGGRTFFDTLLNPWWEFVTTLMPMVRLIRSKGFDRTWHLTLSLSLDSLLTSRDP
jgi:hypothetical protein